MNEFNSRMNGSIDEAPFVHELAKSQSAEYKSRKDVNSDYAVREKIMSVQTTFRGRH